ncbi:MAG: hypothetical protein RL326_362, partial [Pseudomonadota bacterium]
MEGSNSGGKKIVFKKRGVGQSSDALDDLLGDLLAEPVDQERQDESLMPQEPSVDLHYAGEIFDQFYRPIAVEGGLERLSEIASEQLSVPSVSPRLTRA